MSLYKRGTIWWSCFITHGEKFQLSLGTARRAEALKKELKLKIQAEQGHLSATSTDFAKLTFARAVEVYLRDRETAISPKTKSQLAFKTKRTERERARMAVARLGTFPVRKITVELLEAYIEEKRQTVKAGTINRQLDVIRGVLKRAGLWARMADRIKNVPPGEGPGPAFSEEEKAAIEKAAPTRPEWRTA